MPDVITSHQNSFVQHVRRLRDKKARLQDGLFLIDSIRDLERALAQGYAVQFALVVPSMLRDRMPELPARSVFEVTPDIMAKVGYRENPEGIVAVMRTPPTRGADALDAVPDAPILGLVSLTKPGNIGALLRTADGAGFQSIFLIDSRLDLYNPNVIRSSTGAVFLNNIYELTADEARAFFKRRGVQVVGTHLQAAKDAYEVDYRRTCALLLGTEDTGLDDAWLPYCDEQVLIPMAGRIADSLNVSVAGAVLMYEVLRQTRGGAG